MVIERFRDGHPKAVGERFARDGRMMPDEIEYRGSWLDEAGTRCYQIVEAPREELLKIWTSHWDDLVDFEIVPVVTSSEFWSKPRKAIVLRRGHPSLIEQRSQSQFRLCGTREGAKTSRRSVQAEKSQLRIVSTPKRPSGSHR